MSSTTGVNRGCGPQLRGGRQQAAGRPGRGAGRPDGMAAEPGRPGHRAGAGDAAGRGRVDRLVRRRRARPRSRSRRTACTWSAWACPRTRSGTSTRASATPRCGRSTTTSSSPPQFHRRVVGRLRDGQPPLRARPRPSRRRRGRPCGCTTTSSSWCRAMLRELRPDLRIGFFNHIPFPRLRDLRPAAVAAADRRGPARRRPARVPAPGRRHQLPARLPPGCSA